MHVSYSAGGVVIGPDLRLAVVSQGDSWSLPKGHIDAGENALQAAIREIKEETGITQLELVANLGSYERNQIAKGGKGEVKDSLKHIEIFLFKTNQTELSPEDEHNPEARWCNYDEAIKLLTHTKDVQFLKSVGNVIKTYLAR